LDTAAWVKGVAGVDYGGDGKNGWKTYVGDGVLQGERGFDSALPEAGEKHEEKTKLGEQEDGPDSGLSEHVH
jgi:hypothetical protein